MRIFGPDAYANAAKAENARWAAIAPRFGDAPPLRVAHKPKFQLSAKDRFFCIGSCFARNIESALELRGVEVLSQKMFSVAGESQGMRPTSIANKYTTRSIVNEVEWAVGKRGSGRSSFLETLDGVLDLHLVPGGAPVTAERALARRNYMEQDYFARLTQADVVIMTLGLTETWRDEREGVWLNRPPTFAAARREPQRYTVSATTAADNMAALEEARAVLVAARPSLKIVVTVSPVPLRATFSGIDVFTANMRSKATLRAAAAEFADAHGDVDYFPSYEMVIGAGQASFGPDAVHVRNAVVEHVVGAFSDLYIPDAPPPIEGFHENLYLLANPDVMVEVRQAQYSSGLEHWLQVGKAKGRPLVPQNIPQRFYHTGALDMDADADDGD